MEAQYTERDSRAGVDKMTIHRQIGDRSRTLTRQRDRDGREDREESLQGVRTGISVFFFKYDNIHYYLEDASRFDSEWMNAATGTPIMGHQQRIQNTPLTIEYLIFANPRLIVT